MASASSSHRRTEGPDAFSGIEPQGTRRKVDESSRLFDVFINHRGPDVKKTVALQLYNSLTGFGIHTFLDSEEKELGDSFPSTIEKAIRSASAHIAIFSNGYAESPWCLAELVLMLQSTAKIIPLFCGVKPSDLRFVEKGEYGKAFIKYEEKKRYMEKLREWKEALQTVSFITGYEISSNFSDCENIVSAVRKEVKRKKSLHVAKYPVGLNRLVKDFERLCLDKLVQDFERQCRINHGGKENGQIVGIFGMGGVGKTTLAKELFNRKHSQYGRASFLFDVREAYASNSFASLQLRLLTDLFEQDGLKFHCTQEGINHIGDCIRRSDQLSFLIVLDDVDHLQQLDALLIMEMLKKSVDSLVIVTTRDVGMLINTGITVAYNLKGMDRRDARELFCWHAFGQPHPANDYQNLVNSFLDVCGGLPLSLQVLGSHVHGRDLNYWNLELNKVRKTLPRDIHQSLKISFDALDYEEQQIFMDIACFFVDKMKSIAMEVWQASRWSPQHALETLKNKCLVQEIEERFLWVRVGEARFALRMHDHLRDLGREITNGLSRPRRLWRPRDLKYLESKGFQNILARTKARCFHSFADESMRCRVTYFLGESDVSVDTSTLLLWLDLQYQGFQNYGMHNLDSVSLQPIIPSWIPLQNLQYLRIRNLRHKTLWQSHVQAPTELRVLEIKDTCLKEFPDLSGISNNLEKFIIHNWSRLQTMPGLFDLDKLIELNISNCQDLQKLSVVHLSCLERIILHHCYRLKIMSGLSDLEKLIELNISNCQGLQKLSVVHLRCLEKIVLHSCYNLKTVPGISDLKKLVELDISECSEMEQMRLVGLNSLKHFKVDGSWKWTRFELDNCRNLKTISGTLNLQKCVTIIIRDCPKLEVLPSLQGPSTLKTLTIDGCGKFNSLHLSKYQNLKRVTGKFDLSRLCIEDCPELEELPCCAHQTGLEKIRIVRCGKLQNITVPKELVKLGIAECRELKHVSAVCDGNECMELQALSSIVQPSCLTRITIQTFGKIQTIQSIDDNDELRALESFQLSNCLELEGLPGSARQTCLEKISIFKCGQLQNLTIPTEVVKLRIKQSRELKRVATICDHSEWLKLRDLSSVIGMSCLKSITNQICNKQLTIQDIDCLEKIKVGGSGKLTIGGCGKLNSLQLLKCKNLKQLNISDCPKLEELSCCASQSCLEKISIARCKKLQNITLPTKLVELEIEKCRELKTMSMICDHILKLQELHSVARLSCLKRIIIQACGNLQTIQGIKELHALESLQLFNCLELEELPCFAFQMCLKEISIVGCRKLQNITLPRKLVELRIEGCGELKKVAVICDHSECLRLRELSNVAQLSCLKQITIQSCDKLQIIQGTNALDALERMQLAYCSKTAISNCFLKLKSVPPEFFIIGKAVAGALSILNPRLLFDTDAFFSEIGTSSSNERHRVWVESSVVIYCALVVVNISLEDHVLWSNVRMHPGEWIFTWITTGPYDGESDDNCLGHFEYVLVSCGIMKKGYKMAVKKGQEWKTKHILSRIINNLYKK